MALPENAGQGELSPAQWKRAGELFHAALDLPDDEREAWARDNAAGDPDVLAEVLSLLESDRAAGAGFFAQQVEPAVASLARATPLPTGHPSRVGVYRLVRELGQGGMGTVYLAERDDDEYKTQVAIKLVRRGFDTDLVLNRFYRERQTLARLKHPNIARLLDGGTTEGGLPYIVMEYVDGSRITDYCREQAATIQKRLALFLDVCKAVDHAHRQFVVHRDLKPGNIMVDKAGEVKLLDFGICKLLHATPQSGDETLEGSAALSPDYASPEQINGDPITVASDVYSLGAVLYELLTGAKPHRIENYSIQGIEQGVRENPVMKPSEACADRAVARQLQGDLDTILLFALQKDPGRRYPSIEQFAEDVRRYLAHQPVRARPDTLGYRTCKLLRRRGGTIAAAAAAFAALSVATFVSVRSARVANDSLGQVRRLSNTFVFDVYDAVNDLPGSTKARELIVRTGLEYLDNLSRNAAGNLELQRELASAYRRIGDVRGNVRGSHLGNPAEALSAYGKALTLLSAVLTAGPSNREAAVEEVVVHRRIGGVHIYGENRAQALASYGEAMKRAVALLQRFPGDVAAQHQLASIHLGLAEVHRTNGDHGRSREHARKARNLVEPLERDHPEDAELAQTAAEVYTAMGQADAREMNLTAALESYESAAARLERLTRSRPANVSLQRLLMFAYSHVGDVSGYPNMPNLGETAKALEAYTKMTAVARRLHEADPADVRAKSDYGIALARVAMLVPEREPRRRAGLLQQSIGLLADSVRASPGNLNHHSHLGTAHYLLGQTQRALGQDAAALDSYLAGLESTEKVLQPGSAYNVALWVFLCNGASQLLARNGDRDRSLAWARRALEVASPDHATGKDRPTPTQRMLWARAHGGMGAVRAILASGPAGIAGDREAARASLDESLRWFAEIERNRKLSASLLRELAEVRKNRDTLR